MLEVVQHGAPSMNYVVAVHALETNDAAALMTAYRGAAASAVNEKACGGKMSGTPICRPLDCEDGDTMLHLAMRNKRWNIRRALVADPRTDPMIANSRGRTARTHALSTVPHLTPHASTLTPTLTTCHVSRVAPQPPGMQLRESYPRVLLALFCAVLGYLKEAGSVVLVMTGALCLAAGDGN